MAKRREVKVEGSTLHSLYESQFWHRILIHKKNFEVVCSDARYEVVGGPADR